MKTREEIQKEVNEELENRLQKEREQLLKEYIKYGKKKFWVSSERCDEFINKVVKRFPDDFYITEEEEVIKGYLWFPETYVKYFYINIKEEEK